MPLSKRLVEKLLTIANDPPRKHGPSAELLDFCRDFGIPHVGRSQLEFSDVAIQKIRIALKAEGVDPYTAPGTLKLANRVEATERAANEKLAGRSPSDGMVAVKSWRAPLVVGGTSLPLPDGGHLELDYSSLLGNPYSSAIAVENFEVFRQLHRVSWIDAGRVGPMPLVVYLGDQGRSTRWSRILLEQLQRPVYALMDVDPASLGNAMRLPRFAGFLSPPSEHLKSLHADRRGRPDLFSSQIRQWADTLDASPYPDIQKLWALLMEVRCGFTQEHFVF